MKPILLILFCLATLPGCSLKSGNKSNTDGCYVYVSVSDDRKIHTFWLDRTNEELILKGTTELPGVPGSLCTDPEKKVMFAALRSENSVACLGLDMKTGNIRFISATPAIHNPVYISTDRSGKFLYSTSYTENTTAVYGIQDTCLIPVPAQILQARINPHMIKPDPSGKFLFIPNLGGDVVQQFIIRDNGLLTPNTPDTIAVESKSGPRHFIFHPAMNIFYLVNEHGCTVMVFNFDNVKGTLSGPLQVISTLPEDFTGKSYCADIHVTPDGRFLYASNRGYDSLAGFEINKNDGTLKLAGYYPTEKKPREFEIDPSGRFIISAGEGSGKIILYRIEDNGSLIALKTYDVGKWPVWVMALEQ